jgi:hypothetical protein
MSTTVKVVATQKVTVRPDVTDTVTVVIKAVGPQGATGTSTGDMTKAVYDPSSVAGDAFAMDNMVEGTTTKVFTATERTKLAGIQAGATVNDTAAEVKIKYESNSDTNAYTDAEKAKLVTIEENADVTADNETTHADVLVDADIGVSVASFGHNHAGVYEPAFSKNSGFNLALGTGAGQVAEGNHGHSGVYEPADATILKTANIGVDVPALSHNHTEGDITDLRPYIQAGAVTYELLDTNGDVGTGAGQLAIGNHTHTRMTVFVEDIDSELATLHQVPRSDGAGGVTWEDQSAAGLVSGGTTGQVLAKKSATSFDTEWVDLPNDHITIDDAIAMAIALG